MTIRQKTYRNLMCGISLSALLAVVPTGASAQNVVISANDLDGAQFMDINSFSNPGFTLSDLPDGFAGLEIDSIVGDFSNNGMIAGGDYGAFIDGDIGGNFFNSGMIFSDDYGYGVLVDGDIGGNFTNTGNITTAYGYAGVYIDGNIGGNFHNSGDIVNGLEDLTEYAYYGVWLSGDIGGSFTNSGNITTGYYTGVYIGGNIGGDFTNSGRIFSGSAEYDFSYYGLYVAGDVQGNFTNTGDIIADYYTAAYVGGDIEGHFFNSGMIKSGSMDTDFAYYGLYVGGDIEGNFTNTGTISSDYYSGVQVDDAIEGNFWNSGTITSGSMDTIFSYYGVFIGEEVRGNFTNTGHISATYYTGVYLGNVGGDFLNEGHISGGYYGVVIYNELEGNFTNSGSIYSTDGYGGGYDAVFIRGNVGGHFMNSGTIMASPDGNYYGVSVSGNVRGNFVNYGAIIGAEDYYGVVISGDLLGDFINTGVITNRDGDLLGMTYISNLVNGNITTPVGQGVIAGDADISGKTVTGSVNGFVASGTTWNALEVNGTFVNDGAAQMYGSTSALVGITGMITGGDTVELTTATAAFGSVVQGAGGLGLAVAVQSLINEAEANGFASLSEVEQQLLNVLFRQATGLDLGEVLANYSPAGSQGAAGGLNSANQSFLDILARRLGTIATGGQGNSFGLSLGGADGAYQRQAWAQGIGIFSDQSSSGAVGSIDASTAGFAVGVDQTNGEGLLYGFALAVASTDVDAGNADTDVTSFMPAIYAHYQPEQWSGWYASGVIAGNRSDFDSSRFNRFNGETLQADYEGYSFSVRGEVGTDIAVSSVTVTPFLAGTFGHNNIDGYTEAGGISALTVSSSSDSQFALEAGARLSATHGDMTFNAMLGYREDFDSSDVNVTSTLGGGTVFDTDYQIEGSGIFGSLDLVFNAADDIKVTTGVGGVIGEDYSSINGTIKVTKSF